ncbi:MAG: hypothetical protein OER90_09725 [Gemmatimonadota bacterium]|nr:hypothetical protein [Gemmatimonadota bacterium]
MRRIAQLIALAALAVAVIAGTGCERTVTVQETVTEPANCFDCHSDQSTFLVAAEKQWSNSWHASGRTLHEKVRDCKDCHTSEGFVARAAGSPLPSSVTIENPTVIHCFTCHAPHTNGDLRLRWTAPYTLEDGTSYNIGASNLCASCHHSRADVASRTAPTYGLYDRWGPHHGPQSDLLMGTNGYEYASYTYDDLTFHRNTPLDDGSNDGCLKCHFKTELNAVVGGHSFNMEYDLFGEEVFNFGGCDNGACHDGAIEDLDDGFNYQTVQDSVETMLVTLRGLLVAGGLLTDSTGLPVGTSSNRFYTSADSAGAVWNFLIVEEDRSHGVHNSKYIIGLLDSAIKFMQGTLSSPAPVATRRGDDVPGASH